MEFTIANYACVDNLWKKCLNVSLSDKPHENNRRYFATNLTDNQAEIRALVLPLLQPESDPKTSPQPLLRWEGVMKPGYVPELKGFNGMTVDVGAGLVHENTLTGDIAALKAR